MEQKTICFKGMQCSSLHSWRTLSNRLSIILHAQNVKYKVNFNSNIIFFWFCFEKTWWWPRLKVQVSPETSFKTCNPQFIVFLANFHQLIKVSMKSKLMFKGFYQMFCSISYLYTSIRPNNGKKVFSLLSTSCSALSNSRQIDLLVAKVTGNYDILYFLYRHFL